MKRDVCPNHSIIVVLFECKVRLGSRLGVVGKEISEIVFSTLTANIGKLQ